ELEGRNTPRFIGAEIDLSKLESERLDALLFGETLGRIVITTSELDSVKAIERAKLMGVPARRIGTVGEVKGAALKIKSTTGEWSWEVSRLHDLWWNSIDNAMA
ncbi:MAG: phosphoribosylformylglycinamidine synthase II, partial [Verrucomicrobiales bacterium]|nr:phosphoribosylformylglycinamidine synthase II [Verrucomicrobiales bacterium]